MRDDAHVSALVIDIVGHNHTKAWSDHHFKYIMVHAIVWLGYTMYSWQCDITWIRFQTDE